MKWMDQTAMRDVLVTAIGRLGTQTAWANKHDLSVTYVNDLVHGRKEISAPVAKILGFDRHIIFIPRDGRKK